MHREEWLRRESLGLTQGKVSTDHLSPQMGLEARERWAETNKGDRGQQSQRGWDRHRGVT
jgi:hypothetical protein